MDRIQKSNNLGQIHDMSNLNKQLRNVEAEEHDILMPTSFVQIDRQMRNHITTAPKSNILLSQNESDQTHPSNEESADDQVRSDENSSIPVKEDEQILKKVPGKLLTPFKNQTKERQPYEAQMLAKNRKQGKIFDFSQFPLLLRINDQYFKPPNEQIKDEKK